MSDYIKREDAINALYEECNKDQSLSCPYQFFDGIERIPAADVRENVHGEWIDTGSGEECSVCHEIQYGYDSGRRFCASCGAIMDGGDDE